MPTVALVGYTNAGKTTLFNRLTKSDAEASDALFVTLDPLVRQVMLPDRRPLLLSDTVGFIDRLPHTLVAAFRATLEETADADLVLHVIDASNPERERQAAAVNRVLEEVGATARAAARGLQQGRPAHRRTSSGRLREADPSAMLISAATGAGATSCWTRWPPGSPSISSASTLSSTSAIPSRRERLGWIYRHGRVHSQTLERRSRGAGSRPAAPSRGVRPGRGERAPTQPRSSRA